MAVKKTYYPSVKKPGIYSDAEGVTDKELGLNNSDLENFSLGNWNSIRKNSKMIVSTDTGTSNPASEDPRGRPIRMKWGLDELLSFRGNLEDSDNTRANDSTNYPFASYFVKAERNNYGLFTITKVYTGNGSDGDGDGIPYQSYAQLDFGDGEFDGGSDEGQQRRERQQNIVNEYANTGDLGDNKFEITSMRKEVNYEDGFAFIKERANSSNVEDKYVIEFDNNLLNKIRDLIYIKDMSGDYDINQEYDINIDNEEDKLGKLFQFEKIPGNTYEVVFPRFFTIQNPGDDGGVTIELATSLSVLGPLLPMPTIGSSNRTFVLSSENDNAILNKIFTPTKFLQFRMLNANNEYYTPFPQNSDEDDYFKKLGFPNFQYNGLLSHNVTLNRVLFEVICSNKNEEDLLYWENGSEKYLNTSYPLEVTLEMSLFNGNTDASIELENSRDFSGFGALAVSYADSSTAQDFIFGEVKPDVNESFYRYRIIQWGDEKTLLTDEEIENTYFFNFYDNEEYPAPNDYNILRYNQEIIYNSKSFSKKIDHIYLTPGVKSIKIVVYRYSKTGRFILETYLVNKNIVINDGLFTSQDFSIFGVSEFDFLPITDNQAIIGGFETESDYNNSVSKIVKDDNFIQDDYLKRVSSRDYIKKINNGSLGKQPGQLDLGQTRVFTEPKDIYDFIGANKLKWINEGSGSLPINSLATDIFIRDDKCVVDLNPSNSEYSAIQNQAGLEEIGILIGDYKVNQLEGSEIQKEGVMITPLLETDNEKQAF